MAFDRAQYPYAVRLERPSDLVIELVELDARPHYYDEQKALRVGFVTEGNAYAFMRIHGGTFDSKYTHGTTKLVTQNYDVPEGDNS